MLMFILKKSIGAIQNNQGKENWLMQNKIHNEYKALQYVYSFYYVCVTMSTVVIKIEIKIIYF